eukprot:165664-Chlamydomonas_euryale.AAC.1
MATQERATRTRTFARNRIQVGSRQGSQRRAPPFALPVLQSHPMKACLCVVDAVIAFGTVDGLAAPHALRCEAGARSQREGGGETASALSRFAVSLKRDNCNKNSTKAGQNRGGK